MNRITSVLLLVLSVLGLSTGCATQTGRNWAAVAGAGGAAIGGLTHKDPVSGILLGGISGLLAGGLAGDLYERSLQSNQPIEHYADGYRYEVRPYYRQNGQLHPVNPNYRGCREVHFQVFDSRGNLVDDVWRIECQNNQPQHRPQNHQQYRRQDHPQHHVRPEPLRTPTIDWNHAQNLYVQSVNANAIVSDYHNGFRYDAHPHWRDRNGGLHQVDRRHTPPTHCREVLLVVSSGNGVVAEEKWFTNCQGQRQPRRR